MFVLEDVTNSSILIIIESSKINKSGSRKSASYLVNSTFSKVDFVDRVFEGDDLLILQYFGLLKKMRCISKIFTFKRDTGRKTLLAKSVFNIPVKLKLQVSLGFV